MMDKYRKNFILCDGVGYYCLLCDETLLQITNVEKHIRWENHRKSLKNQAYFPKFKKDFIYKIENYFYCEVCNLAVAGIDAVTKHNNSDGHKAMKINPKTEKKIIGQYDSGAIVINKLKLKMAEWNSIIDKTCLICNTAVPNIKLHMLSKEHIVNLMNSESLKENEHYYRKIHHDKYHCFSCKKVYSAQEFNDHWLSCENIDDSKIKEQKEFISCKNTEGGKGNKANDEETHVQSISNFQDFFFISSEKNLASCKNCNAEVAINFITMLGHMNKHSNELELGKNTNITENPDTNGSSDENVYCQIIDYGKRRSELSKYGKENSIKLNFNASKGWCMICDRFLSAHRNIFEQHINGATHQGNLELQGLVSPKKHDTRSIKTKSILQCKLEYIFEYHEFFVLNYLRIDVFSFFLICKIEDKHMNKIKCYVCNELFPQGQEQEHCSTEKHKKKFLAAKFVITFENVGQFIREIRPNYFHCGFCNITMPFLEQVLEHVASLSHKMKQISSNMTEPNMGTIKINTKSDDVYAKLLYCGFRKQ